MPQGSSIQVLSSCATQPHLVSSHIEHIPHTLGSKTPSNAALFPPPSISTNGPLSNFKHVMA